MRVVVGIGANLGKRLSTMREAVTRLARVAGVTVAKRSQVYDSAPIGGPEQPRFLNAAILVECMLTPIALLDQLQRIEAELGRVRGEGEVRWGPRLVDLDVLWIEDLTLDLPRLVVPHPRLHERAFAVLPLIDVAPAAPYAPPNVEAGGIRRTSLTL